MITDAFVPDQHEWYRFILLKPYHITVQINQNSFLVDIGSIPSNETPTQMTYDLNIFKRLNLHACNETRELEQISEIELDHFPYIVSTRKNSTEEVPYNYTCLRSVSLKQSHSDAQLFAFLPLTKCTHIVCFCLFLCFLSVSNLASVFSWLFKSYYYRHCCCCCSCPP